ncbi:MAG: hypothetical protein K5984_01255 [Bacteroidales bacterium]|nr:hypothetical protein [Bacteroidales bacterium]
MKNFRILFAAAVTVLTAACESDFLEFGRPRSDGGSQGHKEKVDTTVTKTLPDTAVWVTAVAFPEDYNWGIDSLRGYNDAVIQLYCNGEKKLSIPAGDNFRISSHEDMNRYLNGAIYSDWYDGHNTFLQKNGQMVACWPGQHMISGMLMQGDTLWTLASNRKGKGFILLKNGNEEFSSEIGKVYGDMYDSISKTGALYESQGQLCFCFYEEDKVGGFKKKTYSIWKDGKVYQVDAQVEEVDDIRVCDGRVFIVGRNPSDRDIVRLIIDGSQKLLTGTRNQKIGNCKIFQVGETVYVRGLEYVTRKTSNTVIWTAGGLVKRIIDRKCYFYPNGSELGLIECDWVGREVTIGSLKKQDSYGYMGRFVSPRCATYFDGKPYVAFQWGTEGFVTWHNGDTTKVNINGFAVSIDVTVNK